MVRFNAHLRFVAFFEDIRRPYVKFELCFLNFLSLTVTLTELQLCMA